MIATVPVGLDRTLTVRADDLDPFVTVVLGPWSAVLTREEARRAGDALRAAALTAVDGPGTG
jgi:hypothetical protein